MKNFLLASVAILSSAVSFASHVVPAGGVTTSAKSELSLPGLTCHSSITSTYVDSIILSYAELDLTWALNLAPLNLKGQHTRAIAMTNDCDFLKEIQAMLPVGPVPMLEVSVSVTKTSSLKYDYEYVSVKLPQGVELISEVAIPR